MLTPSRERTLECWRTLCVWVGVWCVVCGVWCVVCGVWWVWVCEGVPLYSYAQLSFYCQFKLLFCVKHWKVQDFFVDVRGHSLHGLNRSEKGLPLLRTGPLLELLHHHSCLLLSR